jgi:hypothetical protein
VVTHYEGAQVWRLDPCAASLWLEDILHLIMKLLSEVCADDEHRELWIVWSVRELSFSGALESLFRSRT